VSDKYGAIARIAHARASEADWFVVFALWSLTLGFSGGRIPVQNQSTKYGYARVSTDGQSIDAQVRQLKAAPAGRFRRWATQDNSTLSDWIGFYGIDPLARSAIDPRKSGGHSVSNTRAAHGERVKSAGAGREGKA
jgi:hypothetical protein